MMMGKSALLASRGREHFCPLSNFLWGGFFFLWTFEVLAWVVAEKVFISSNGHSWCCFCEKFYWKLEKIMIKIANFVVSTIDTKYFEYFLRPSLLHYPFHLDVFPRCCSRFSPGKIKSQTAQTSVALVFFFLLTLLPATPVQMKS